MKNQTITEILYSFQPKNEHVPASGTIISLNDEGVIIGVDRYSASTIDQFHDRLRTNARAGEDAVPANQWIEVEPYSLRYSLVQDAEVAHLVWSDDNGIPEAVKTYDVTNPGEFSNFAYDLLIAIKERRTIL